MKSLSEYLVGLFPKREHLFVCFTGGGGKTTALQTLGAYFKKKGKTVLLTTTTKFQNPMTYGWKADLCFTRAEEIMDFDPQEYRGKGVTVVYGEFLSPEKLSSPSMATLSNLKDRFDVVLCEADGSRGLPFKVHTERDPVIPPWTDFTISVVGSDGVLENASEKTFGFENLKNRPAEDAVADADYLSVLASEKEGFFKGTEEGKRALLLNKADLCTQQQANVFLNVQWPADCAIIYASAWLDCIYSLIQTGNYR